MRLIDANRARETTTLDLIVHHLDRQPTIDAVPVVRCKDCKYNEDGECVCSRMCISACAHFYTYPDDFCSYGERRGAAK